MFGNQNDREKRTPTDIRYSNRKLAGQGGNSGGSSGGSGGSGGGSGGSGGGDYGGLIALIAAAIYGLFHLFSSKKDANGQKPKKGCGCLLLILILVAVGLFVFYLLGDDELALDSPSPTNNAVVQQTRPPAQGPIGYADLLTNVQPAAQKPYTVLVYMCGSNLESKYGAATSDLREMVQSRFNTDTLNVLVLTGGAKKWKTQNMSANLTLYSLSPQGLSPIADLGMGSMGDPNLLKTFVDYAYAAFPADRYGFVFWDHGGGPLHGYGADENFQNAGLSIAQIRDAFAASRAGRTPLEFVGFDCCLMGSIETAQLLSPYARYFIASEELEPGDGWDYAFLKTLSDAPDMSGAQIGKNVVDLYSAFYSRRSEDITLSVVDLGKLGPLSEAFSAYGDSVRGLIDQGGFNAVSRARRNTKTFGYTGENESYDLVDILHLVRNLSSAFPAESQRVIDAFSDCVVYNQSNIANANGLTTYIPYISKSLAGNSVSSYERLGVMPGFTRFLVSFTEKLTGRKVPRAQIERAQPTLDQGGDVAIALDPATLDEINTIRFVIWRQLRPDSDEFIRLGLSSDVEIQDDGRITTTFDGYWATLGGQTACFYEIERNGDATKYAVPAMLNDVEVNLQVVFTPDHPDGMVLGAVPPSPEGSSVAARTLTPVVPGDRIALLYLTQLFVDADQAAGTAASDAWIQGDAFTVGESLDVEIVPVDDELYLYGFWIEDTQKNDYYTDFIEIRY